MSASQNMRLIIGNIVWHNNHGMQGEPRKIDNFKVVQQMNCGDTSHVDSLLVWLQRGTVKCVHRNFGIYY